METTIKCNKKDDFVVVLEDLENDDELITLSKEIEKTKLEDTIDLSKCIENTLGFSTNDSSN